MLTCILMRSCGGPVSARFVGHTKFVGYFCAVAIATNLYFATNQLCGEEAKNTSKSGAKSLFDGKSLQGWEGNLDYFRVEEGAIVAGRTDRPIPNNEFLCTTNEYGDFELELKVKIRAEAANGGIQFRSRRVPNDHEVSGYQADVGAGWWGKLYDESRRNRVLAGPSDEAAVAKSVKSDGWNDYKIRCEGGRIQLWLNGVQTVNYQEPDEQVARRGVIAVQIHSGPAAEICYKDLKITELNSAE